MCFALHRRHPEKKNGRKKLDVVFRSFWKRKRATTAADGTFYVVTNTGDSAVIGSGSLQAVVMAADADTGDMSPATINITFNIPAGQPGDLSDPFRDSIQAPKTGRS